MNTGAVNEVRRKRGDRAVSERAADAGPNATQHEQHRFDDLHRDHPLSQHEALAVPDMVLR
jgi:hypothetical protein